MRYDLKFRSCQIQTLLLFTPKKTKPLSRSLKTFSNFRGPLQGLRTLI